MTKALIFDMDGTITLAGQKATRKVMDELNRVRTKYKMYLATGSGYTKVEEQLVVVEVSNGIELKFQKPSISAALPKGTLKSGE